ncbi:MAG: phosphatase PAP2 family protein [Bacteroidota bacterium]|nr:phosphatase PAP2 family protein [Bacteroidota bacterium]MDP4191720.1 phosphatase PAP2 family protein [Bacteroidota bacterium]MDP4196453.1 phosphatase PAP2 family protein [Bacteroidota bacterium]
MLKNKTDNIKSAGTFWPLILTLNITDLIVIAFYFFLTVLNLLFWNRIEQWYLLIVVNVIVTLFVFSAASFDDKGKSKFWSIIHYWYLAPLILLTFKELYLMIKPIRIHDYDYILINADRFIFGTDPTRVLLKIANPFLTELLQIAYGSFYILPIVLGLNLYLLKRNTALDFSLFAVVYGFFLSYIGYFFLPAIGPRFTLHNFYDINNDLPGLFLTNFLREIVNTGESIPFGTPNPASVVQRDVFPSGHTQMTLITMYLATRFNVKSKYFLLPTGSLLIFATVYLRYHYVIDLLGGTVFMIITMWSGKYIYNKWQKVKGKELFSYDSLY